MNTANATGANEHSSATRLMWGAGFAVAAGAAVATAHGLYEVARAAGAPAPIAGLYPLMADGLALVAYAATTRMDRVGRRYAWAVVVLAAGLSGLAQAAYLAGGVHVAPSWLRFGVGAWPALAAAVVAHLLYLLGTSGTALSTRVSNPSNAPYNRPTSTLDTVERLHGAPSNPDPAVAVEDGDADESAATAPARDRAKVAAQAHRDRHGTLPSVNELAALADVARGTAATALRELRHDGTTLHAVPTQPTTRSDR